MHFGSNCGNILCDAGTYSNSLTATACNACPAGTYSDNSGQSVCTGCPIGTYGAAQGALSSSACTPCTNLPSNSYYTGNGGASNACPYSSCGACAVGYFMSGCSGTSAGACAPCTVLPANSYYNDSGGTSDTCPYSSCGGCSAGSFTSGCGGTSAGTCTQCANPCASLYGQFSTCGGTDPGSCVWCTNAGTYNYYTKQGGFTSACPLASSPVGTYRAIAYPRAPYTMTLSGGGNTVAGTFTYQGMVNSQPQYYASGWYVWWWDHLWIFSTAKGDVGGNAGKLLGPSFDSYAHVSGEQYVIEPLLDQTASNTIWYLPCNTGAYAANTGMTACLACPAGTYASTTHQSACSLCGIGTYMPSTGFTKCTTCPTGKYMDNRGATVCAGCGLGSYAGSTGLSACLACASGKFGPSQGLSACPSCYTGTYADATGYSACLACAQCTYAGSTGAGACTSCPAGTYAGSTGFSACALCAVGSYAGSTGLSACVTCASGTYGASKGLTACLSCTTPTCAAGYYFTACLPASNIACAPCPPVFECAYTGNVCNDPGTGAPLCDCVPGYYKNAAGVCAGCAAGRFSSVSGATSSDTCVLCLPGSTTRTTDSGMSACTDCALLNQALPLSAYYSAAGGDPLVCAWNCDDGYVRVNYSQAAFSVSSYTALSYSASEAPQLFHAANDYCCNPLTAKTGEYLSGCSRAAPGSSTPCPPLPNGYYTDSGTPKLNRCGDWACNVWYYPGKTSCVAQPACGPGYTYQRDAAGGFVALANGSFVCAPCSPCMAGSEVLVPCNSTVDTQCVLCGPTEFSIRGGACVGAPPYGFVGVIVQLTSQPPFQGRPLYLSDGLTAIDWGSVAAGGFFINTFSPCQPVPTSYVYTGGDLPCRRRDTDPASQCPVSPCNTQCRPWDGSAGWFMLRGQCAPCVYDATCTATQYSDLSVCGPTSAPVCTPCPSAVLPNAVGWANPGRALPPGGPPCTALCRDGFQLSMGACVPCPSLPNNSKITSGCSWTCSLGFVQSGASLCVPCAGVPASCPLGTYLGFPATTASNPCPRCLPCTNTVANSAFASPGSVNGPNTCLIVCNPGFYAAGTLDAFGNPVTCSQCTQPQCAAGVSFAVPCSAAADAFCQPCSGCPSGYAVDRPCTPGANNTCMECRPNPMRPGLFFDAGVVLPLGASWSAPGCVQWECSAGFYPVADQCAPCAQPHNCTKSDSYGYVIPGCGVCTPCNASLLLPFQCFNGDGQCGTTYWCGYTTTAAATTTTAPGTSTTTPPIAPSTTAAAAYASLMTLKIPAGTPLQTITQSILCQQQCSVQVLSVTIDNVTTYCSPNGGCAGRRRLLQQGVMLIEVGIITPTAQIAPPAVASSLQPIAVLVTGSYLVHNASVLADASQLSGYIRGMESDARRDKGVSTTNIYIMSSVCAAIALLALAAMCSACVMKERTRGAEVGGGGARSQFRWDGVKIRLA